MDSDDEIMNKLILDGALEVSAMDQETGELLYSFTPKIKDVMPELYKEHMQTVNKDIMNLWEKGFVNMDFFVQDPTITLTDKAFDINLIKKLSKQEQWSLFEVKRLLKRKV
jgi:hypothetical protein